MDERNKDTVGREKVVQMVEDFARSHHLPENQRLEVSAMMLDAYDVGRVQGIRYGCDELANDIKAKTMTPKEVEIYTANICEIATATDSDFEIVVGGKRALFTVERLQAFEDKVGKGRVTLGVLAAYCIENGQASALNDNNVRYRFIGRTSND